VNAYQLQTTGNAGPIPSATPYANSGNQPNNGYPILFCDHSPTPSVSSSGTNAGSGIVWAVEQNQNNDNYQSYTPDCAPAGQGNGGGHRSPQNPAALHAFCAAGSTVQGSPCQNGAMTELYSSRKLQTALGQGDSFPVPTIFNGYVYIGTDPNKASGGSGSDGEIDVFGICANGPNGKCQT